MHEIDRGEVWPFFPFSISTSQRRKGGKQFEPKGKNVKDDLLLKRKMKRLLVIKLGSGSTQLGLGREFGFFFFLVELVAQPFHDP